MSGYSIVPNAALTATADAIRTKSGSQDTIEFDHNTGFKDAVDAIPSGGTDYMAQNIQGTLTSYESDDVTVIRGNAFRGYSGLTTLKLHNVTDIKSTGIYECSGLTALAFPSLSGSEKVSIRVCSHLAALDLGAGLTRIGGSSLDGNTIMNVLVLRRTGGVTALGNINALSNTPFASGKAGGTIYIPKVLYDHLGDGTSSDYKAATNWSTIEGYGTITWAKIEGSQYENYYADGTPIPTT